MMNININSNNPSTREMLTDKAGEGVPRTRQPYTPPRVHVTQPSIQGGDVNELNESEGGLWTS